MKTKILTIATVIILGLTSCGGRSSNNQNAHSPENCTEHNHTSEQPVPPKQESFKLDTDSVTINADSVKNNRVHDHNQGECDHNH